MKAYQEKKNAKHKSSEKIQSISVKNLDSEIAGTSVVQKPEIIMVTSNFLNAK